MDQPGRLHNGSMAKYLFFVGLLALGFSAGAQAFELSPESFVEYEASDPRESWTGRAPIADLELTLDPNNVRATQLVVTLNPGQFDSGSFIRDANARRSVFETGTYPDITFTATRISTPDNAVPEGDTREVSLRGDLTMHGVTQTVSFPVSVRREENRLSVTGEVEVLLSDFEMTRPKFLNWVVEDKVKVRLNVMGALTP